MRAQDATGCRSDANIMSMNLQCVRSFVSVCSVSGCSFPSDHVCFVSPALCVRFITKRFIGEYDHKKGEPAVNILSELAWKNDLTMHCSPMSLTDRI